MNLIILRPRILILFALLNLYTNNLKCQNDSISFNHNEVGYYHIAKDLISIDLLYTLPPIVDGDFGLGLNYERNLKGVSSLNILMEYQKRNGTDTYDLFFGTVGYKFYLGKTSQKIGEKRIKGEKYLLYKKSRSVKFPKGFYCGPIIAFDGNIQNSASWDYDNNIRIEEPDYFNYKVGLGANTGYQFLLGDRFILNFSLPLAYGIEYKFEKSLEGEVVNKEFKPSFFGNLNLNIGYSF